MKAGIQKFISNKKVHRIAIWTGSIFLVVLLGLGIIVFALRESFFQKVLTKVISKAKTEYQVDIQVKKSGFSGLNTVYLQNLSVVPEQRDTLLSLSEIRVSVSIFPMLFGNIKLSEIILKDGQFQVVKNDSLSNLDFIFKRKPQTNRDDSNQKTAFSEIADNLLNEILYKIPNDMRVQNFSVELIINHQKQMSFYTALSEIQSGNLNAEIQVDSNFATWNITGKLNPNRKHLSLEWTAKRQDVELPKYLQEKYKTQISFQKVKTELKDAYFRKGNFEMLGAWAIENLKLNQERIAQNDIFIKNSKIEAQVIVGDDFIALGEETQVFIKNAVLKPYIKYTIRPYKIYELKLAVDKQKAQDLVEAFPEGLFDSMDGMRVAGEIQYNLSFKLDSREPDSLHFESRISPRQFKINQWGKTDLSKINSDFIYTPYEYGKPMRNIVVGPANPNFTPLDQVSENFKQAILTSEDPSFFSHKGFVEQSIRNSIAVNFKEKRFKRGGSTISMQLVKNVFLNRNKTISRKLEEILIVWLIENNGIVSKNRMLEVYFNIIEMGNNIYGIGEASHYYFGKSPSELSVGEGIFLANIVPRPKIALFKFQSDGHLKPYLQNYFNFIGNTMARRGKIAADSSSYGFHQVRIRENLRMLLLPDSVQIDTNTTDEDIEPEVINQNPLNLKL